MSKDQHKVGIPAKPRGQETGRGDNPDQNRDEMEETPAVSGRRKKANKMFGDKSSQHVASDATKPSTNAPSTIAMPTRKQGESGGERVFKERLRAKRRSTKRV